MMKVKNSISMKGEWHLQDGRVLRMSTFSIGLMQTINCNICNHYICLFAHTR